MIVYWEWTLTSCVQLPAWQWSPRKTSSVWSKSHDKHVWIANLTLYSWVPAYGVCFGLFNGKWFCHNISIKMSWSHNCCWFLYIAYVQFNSPWPAREVSLELKWLSCIVFRVEECRPVCFLCLTGRSPQLTPEWNRCWKMTKKKLDCSVSVNWDFLLDLMLYETSPSIRQQPLLMKPKTKTVQERLCKSSIKCQIPFAKWPILPSLFE